MYRRYYSYSDMPQMVMHNDKPKEECVKEEKQESCEAQGSQSNKVLGRFELDDIILGIVILALLLDDGDDSVLLIALAIIFLTGIY